MNIKVWNENGVDIAQVDHHDILITDMQSALDLMATVTYEAGCNRMIIRKSLISEGFFDLKTRLAGDIIQKFINYQFKVAIIGDFSMYSSKSLKDFIFESNNGKDLFFLSDEHEAVRRLSKV